MNDWYYDEYEKLYVGMIHRYPDPDCPGFFECPEAGRALYVVLIFDMEVQNGGLAQFFWNCGAEYARLLPDALRTTGLDDVADLYESFVCENRITPDIAATFREYDPEFEEVYEWYDYDAFDEPYMKIWEETDINRRFLDYAAEHPEIWDTPSFRNCGEDCPLPDAPSADGLSDVAELYEDFLRESGSTPDAIASLTGIPQPPDAGSADAWRDMVVYEIKKAYLDGGRANTLKHAEEVAETAVWLAEVHGLDPWKAKLASLLHDLSAVMTPQEMYETITARGLPTDPAEEKYHFLLHQRVSRILAEERFGVRDEDVLSAIECHTTLKKNAGPYDEAVFIADKISWDQEGAPPYLDALKKLAASSLDEACFFYIDYQFRNGLLLMPHRWIAEAYEDLRVRLKKPGN